MTPTTIVFVTPRYGLEIVGGAERLVRFLAEQLAAAGRPVEVLTTCVESIAEMRNTLPPGVSELNGVTLRRFRADETDISRYYRVAALAQSGQPVSYADQLEFVRHSINSGPLYEHLRSHRDDYLCAIFAPYMFGTTYWGVQAVPDKALLIPCIHDEPFAYFDIVRDLLEGAQGIIFNSEPERDFAYERLGLINQRSAVVGMGFTPQPASDAEAFRKRHNLHGPTLFYTGRLEEGKNVPLLIDYFSRYANERTGSGHGTGRGGEGGEGGEGGGGHGRAALRTADPPWPPPWPPSPPPPPPTLALGGRGEITLPDHPNIVRLGFIEENDLPNAFAAATIFCQPSVHESLSIVLMESWLQGRPALVHGDCAVTSYYVNRTGGGLTFRTYEEFRAALDQFIADPAAADAMGARGRAFVLSEFSPEAVYARLVAALDRFTAPRTQYDTLSQRAIVHARSFSRERFDERMGRVLAEVEAEAAGQGISSQQASTLRQAALVGMPDYVVRSGAPYGLGRLVAWARRNLTSHLREPYLDPIIARQEQFNRQVLDVLLPALERSTRAQQRLERQVRLLEREVAELRERDNA